MPGELINDWSCGLDERPRMVMWRPADDLAPFVSGYSLYVVGPDDEPHRGAFEPAGASLRIALVTDWWTVRPAGGDLIDPPRVSVFGPSSSLVWSESGGGALVGFGIRPRGWLRLFRCKARAWADRIAEPECFGSLSVEEIKARFTGVVEDDDVPARFDALLREAMAEPTGDDAGVADFEIALADPTIATVEELCARTGRSIRSLQRLADRAFGFPPKILLRRARFLRSLHAMRATRRDERALVIDPGYTDYSHFVRDSHDFLGMSPKAFLENEMPLLRDSLALRTRVLGAPAQVLDPVSPVSGATPADA